MIRDFWGVTKKKLYDEIEAIKDKVDTKTWEGIDAIRKIGNIGAHMENDINLVIDVDPNEANLLINLIEFLLYEWYVTKHDRDESINKLIELSVEKDASKQKKDSSD